MSLLSAVMAQIFRAVAPPVGETYEVFLAGGTFNVPLGVTSVDVLLVAGGGGGSARYGGGGAGGVRVLEGYSVTPEAAVTVVVGAGGDGSLFNGEDGEDGGDSAFDGQTVVGGGGGGNGNGRAGGSGGGAGRGVTAANTGGAGTSGQGNNGGNASPSGGSGTAAGGGGGGKAAAGQNATNGNGGDGGDGITLESIGWDAVIGAPPAVGGGGGGGGGGISAGNVGAGGLGGGGAGAHNDSIPGEDGTINTGGGGGGGGIVPSAQGQGGGDGGSGLVIVRWKGDLWTPADITTALWLDAADTGTITLNSGAVEQWDDKSGNLRHVSQTATPAARPGYTSGVSVNFDGSNDILFRTDAFMYAAGAGTTYVVAKWTAASSATLIAEGSSTTNNTVYDRRQHTTGGIMTCFIRNDANSIRLDPANALGGVGADNTFKIQCWRDTETEVSSFVNGVDGGTPRAYTRSGALTPDRFAVGGLQRASAALFSTAEVSEVIHVAEASTPAERQRIEGYLAHKWGLEANLPSGHPYKNAPPTTAWTPADTTSALWLDADDASTFTLTGSDIDQLADKSGNARHATPATATKPTRTATGINSMGSIVFGSGTDPLITPSFAPPAAADGLMAFAVYVRTGVPVNYSNPFTFGAVNAQFSLILGSPALSIANGRDKYFWRNGTGGTTTATSPEDVVITNTPALWSGVMSNAGIDQYLNGTLLVGSAGAATRNLGASAVMTIGSSPDATYATNRLQGQLAEYILVPADITTATRQRIEGYLAWKWGMEGDLDAGHPYKSAAPTVGGSSYHQLVLDASPLQYWRLDETSGTTLEDAVGTNDLTIAGTYTLDIAPTTEVEGRAIKFTSAGATPVTQTVPANGTNGYTVEFLVKLFSADSAANAYIYSRANSGDVVFNYGGGNRIGIFKNTGGGTAVTTTALGPIIPRDDQWHHVVIGYNNVAGRWEAWLDGQFNSRFIVATAPTFNTTQRLGRSTNNAAPFVGGLDEFAVYDRWLTQDEIQAHAFRALQGASPAATTWSSAASLKNSLVTLSNGDADMTKTGAGYRSVYATRGRSSGIYAFECEVVSRVSISSILVGFADVDNAATVLGTFVGTSVVNTIGWNDNNGSGSGRVYRNMTAGSDSGAITTAYEPGDILTISLDFDTNTASFYKNGVLAFTRAVTAGRWYVPVASVQNGPVIRIRGSGLTHLPAGATEWDA